MSFPRYRFYRLDRQSGEHGGVAIAVDRNIKHKHIPLPPTNVIEADCYQCRYSRWRDHFYFGVFSGNRSYKTFER